MKKIFAFLNPRNYSMTAQLFLIFFFTFIVFLLTEVYVINTMNNSTSKKYYNDCLSVAHTLIDDYDDTTNNYLKLKSFCNDNFSYIINTNDELQIEDTFSTIGITINNKDYYIPSIHGGLQVNDEITYCLDTKGNLIKINDTSYFNIPVFETLQGVINKIQYPQTLNSEFYSNEFVILALEELQKQDISQSIDLGLSKDNISLYIFGKKINTGYLLIIMPTMLDSKLSTNLSIFQTLMFVCMLIIFIILTLFMKHIYAEPIKHIGLVANNIKNLNFDVYSNEYQNKDYRRLSSEINDLNDSLKDIIDNLNMKNGEITRYSEEMKKEYQFKKQLVATISHEIKTPLAIMQATVDGILDGIFEGEDITVELNNVLREIQGTNEMLQEIVQLYQLESDTFKLKFEEVNITSLLSEATTLFQKIAERYEQQIIFINQPELIVKADLKQITRVINNILLNAITYSPPKNKITIEFKSFKTHNILEVINYGTSIEAVDLDKLFEPFYRVDKSRKKSDDHGNGLGLYLVKETLKKHNFEFGIENVMDGVKFYIIFTTKGQK